MISTAVLLLLFAVTCWAILKRPLGIDGAWWALFAAVGSLASGLVTPDGAGAAVGQTADVLTFFGGLLVMAAVLQRAGAVDLLMDRLEIWAGFSTRRLLVGILALTALVTAVLSNDAAALLLAPAVVSRVRARGLPPALFLLGLAVVTNSASLLLPVSNPVNLLLLDRDHLQFAHYLVIVTPGALAGLLLSAAAVVALLWRLPTRSAPATPGRDLSNGLLVALAALVAVLAAADVVLVVLGQPLGPPTALAALLALVLLGRRQPGAAREALKRARWTLLPLVVGLAVLASGLQQAHLLGELLAPIAGAPSGPMAQARVGASAAVLSAAINNLPTAFLFGAGLTAAHHLHAFTIPVIVGADLGPNLAPAGSLSTILAFSAGDRPRERPSLRSFFKVGWIAGPVGMLATLVVAGLVR